MSGFVVVPAIAAISPLLVLPVVARTAGAGGWSSAIAGEAIGTFAAIGIGYGWAAIGPALVSIAQTDAHRARLYRDSLVVRLILAAAILPILGVVCWFVATPGAQWLSVLMGAQGALIALSFTWYSAGVGDPRAIILYDAVPRLAASVVSAVLIANVGVVELYPLAGICVTVVGTCIFTVKVLRANPGPWPARADLPQLFRKGAPVALNDAGLGAYSNVPTPLVNVVSTEIPAAGFASADKMLKLGQFLPLTLANALQAWIGEAHDAMRARRMRIALIAHGGFGLVGGACLALLGPLASEILFGQDASAPAAVLLSMGIVFAFFCLRTSMSRHILFAAGQANVVMRATLLGTALGVPAMVGLGVAFGPVGAAAGYALTEAAATVLLVSHCRRVLTRLSIGGA
jgi:PST family polysaccharide transporter